MNRYKRKMKALIARIEKLKESIRCQELEIESDLMRLKQN